MILCFSLGEKAGEITKALQGFHHPKAEKKHFLTDIAQVWIKTCTFFF
jgi:Ser/Thr protein kinase RdoA (MazF antagonist)